MSNTLWLTHSYEQLSGRTAIRVSGVSWPSASNTHSPLQGEWMRNYQTPSPLWGDWDEHFLWLSWPLGSHYTLVPLRWVDERNSNTLTPSEWVGWTLSMVEKAFDQPYTLPPLGVSGWKEAKRTQPFRVSWMDVSYAWGGECNGGMGRGKDGQTAWVELA